MTSMDSENRDPPDQAFEIDDLKRGVVHVWHIGLNAAVSFAEMRAVPLTEGELAHAARISREPVRQRFVATRVVLKSILGRYLRVSPAALAFDQGEHGKPRLAGTEPDRGLVFNVSHTENQLAIALAFDARLGVDIEFWRPLHDFSAVASRCFAPTELVHWNCLPESERLPAFFRLWTLKEAFCKAVGRGLALGLQHCVFDCSQPQLLDWPDRATDPAQQWYFQEMGDLSSTSGAVASDRAPAGVRRFDAKTWSWTFLPMRSSTSTPENPLTELRICASAQAR